MSKRQSYPPCPSDDNKVYRNDCPPDYFPSKFRSKHANIATFSLFPAASSSSDTMSSSPSSSASSFTSSNAPNIPVGAVIFLPAAQSLATSIAFPSNVPATTSVSSSVPAATSAGQLAPQTTTAVPKSNTTAIAGGVAGGVVGLALIVALLAICNRRRTTRLQEYRNEGRSPTWGSGQARSIQPDDAELEEIKQGPSPTSSSLRPPPPSPLTSPPAYTPYRSHINELDRAPDLSQPPTSSPYPSHDLPSPESPPSPPPLETRLSQHSEDRYSDGQSVSPISSHYQHQPSGETENPELSMYSEVSSSALLHTHSMRS